MDKWYGETQSPESEEKRVLADGPWDQGRVRYSLKGNNPTIFALEARYPKKGEGKKWQVQELAGWSFFLGNLKSKAMKGPDLRSKSTKFTWKKGFLD